MRTCWLLSIAGLLAGCSPFAGTPGDAAPPNVLLIVTDDQGWGEVGARGHPHLRTPALDAMAQRGITLDRFYAAAPVCSPTRASLLTGRHPVRTRTLAWGHVLPGEEQTVAELLAARGYATGHFGKWHLGSVRAGEATSPGAQGFEEWASSPNFFDLDPRLSVNGRVVESRGEGSDVVTDRALEFVRAAVACGRPFFAVVSYGNPHLPHVALDDDLAAQSHAPADARSYYAEIEAVDRNVGRLRDALEELGVARDTLTWFTSDNGPLAPGSAEAHETAGLRGRKGSLWEGGVRVPCLITMPGVVAAGSRSSAVAGTVDVLPTLLDLAGAAPPAATLDGISLAPVLRGEPRARPRGLGFWTPPAKGRAQHAERILAAQLAGERHPEETLPVVDLGFASQRPFPGHGVWIEGDWKLHAFPGEASVRFELYELAGDPAESVDVAARHPERVERMRAALDAWQRSIAGELSGR